MDNEKEECVMFDHGERFLTGEQCKWKEQEKQQRQE